MENEPVLLADDEDDEAEYLLLERQVELVHEEEGIQRSEEPVSKSMRNF